MDTSHHHDEVRRASPTERVQDQIQSLLGDPVQTQPVDVRSFLLDPPPTPEQAERDERRRRLVRRGSIVVVATIIVALLVPIPKRDAHDPPAVAVADPAAKPVASSVSAPQLPVRIDRPTPRRRASPAQHQRAPAPVPASRLPAHAPVSPAPIATPRAPVRRTSPPPVASEGVLVPLM